MGRTKILKTFFLYADKEIFLIPFQYHIPQEINNMQVKNEALL